MSEEFDFSELRKYLQGQMDLGDAEVFFDEPWALTRGKSRPVARPAVPTTPRPQPVVQPAPQPSLQSTPQPAIQPAPSIPLFENVAPRPVVKRAPSAFESAESLEAFYTQIASESIYGGAQSLARYEGPEHPELLLLMPAPVALDPQSKFMNSATGEMLARLFASLHIEQSNIGVTYFYKNAPARALSPLLETVLRKMLAKELSFISPKFMVTFGESLFHQVFGKGKSFSDLAGCDMEFNGVKATALADANAMTNDKQLKWVTWKVHIPRSTYFKP
ncbi:hypothetical protein [Fibrobacter sp.]|uniref:hypothetical protein n=1 Tax=Fibrobacter sp. TaxID=35828 RepID=UPI00388DD515